MSKYNYDKSVLKGLGVGDFLNETKVRAGKIAEGEATIPTSVYNPNILAKKLHPSYQLGIITQINDYGTAKTFVIAPDKANGTEELAYFRAGQYVSVAVEFDGKYFCKPYSLSSGPKNALGSENNTYAITVKKTENGNVSEYILGNWKVGDTILLSGPLGNFYFERLRDSKNIIAIAGGSGITPFASMAKAISEGIEDFNLTILYGSKTRDNILLKDELEKCALESNGKVRIVHVLSDDKMNDTLGGYEYGFISADLIKKYAPDDYSIFVCGPKALYNYEKEELKKLGLPQRKIRFEMSGEYGDPTSDDNYPKDKSGREFSLRVWIRGESTDLKCKSEESLLLTMENAGIHVPSDCRSGQCGWCHSRLINGEVYIPESHDGRREGDKKFGWIHPCATYPLSDIEIEVFPIH